MWHYILTSFGDVCEPKTFFLIPSWYKYLYESGRLRFNSSSRACELTGNFKFEDLYLVGLGIFEILVRVAGLVAVGFIIYGGVLYVTSQGEPDKAKRAQQTIINALIGLLIAILASAMVAFIGSRVG